MAATKKSKYKLVFSKDKCIKDLIKCLGEQNRAVIERSAWIKECDGLTVQECAALGYMTHSEWFEKVPIKEEK